MGVIAPFPQHTRMSALSRDGGAVGGGWSMLHAAHVVSESLLARSCDWQFLAEALTSLGPVLHVDTRAAGEPVHLPEDAPRPARSELVGLACAARVVAGVRLDSDGPGEGLYFLDERDTPLASLWLLPDSDFLTWEALVSHLPAMQLPEQAWQCSQCHASRGRARVRYFECIRVMRGAWLDAAIPARLSSIGQERARQLARAVGASLLA